MQPCPALHKAKAAEAAHCDNREDQILGKENALRAGCHKEDTLRAGCHRDDKQWDKHFASHTAQS